MQINRRQFLATSACAAAPFLIAGCSTAATARAYKVNGIIKVGVIGLGRIAITMDMPGVMAFPDKCRITAVCDLDRMRLDNGKKFVEEGYAKKNIVQKVDTYEDYIDMIDNAGVDAVMVCVPDHWHAMCAVAAIAAGKHIWLQKPFAQTIKEGRLIANLAKKTGCVMQVGAWQRSRKNFHDICELARNGRVGEIVRVEIGIGCDRSGGMAKEEPVPATFDYEKWLGPTPDGVPYNWTRCHTQDLKRIGDRPGWIQLAPYGWGMITNWGAHHLDIMHWGLGQDFGGPDSVRGTCEWMDTSGGKLWNVHTRYDLHYTYGKTDVHVCNKFPMGVKFVGEKGDWLYCQRGGGKVTPSDPKGDGKMGPFMASDIKLLEPIVNPAVKLKVSNNHFGNWLDGIALGDPDYTINCAEAAHRSTATCSLGHMVMELGRGKKDGAEIKWDHKAETTGNAEADKLMEPFARGKYNLCSVLKHYGLSYASVMKG